MSRTVFTVRDADQPISDRATFRAASMWAHATDAEHQYRGSSGYLPADWLATFYADTADGMAYIVYSYNTPIGWERSDGLRVVPPVTYSVTTARHQSKLRQAWGMSYWANRNRRTIYSHRDGQQAIHDAA